MLYPIVRAFCPGMSRGLARLGSLLRRLLRGWPASLGLSDGFLSGPAPETPRRSAEGGGELGSRNEDCLRDRTGGGVLKAGQRQGSVVAT